jgi:uncharacterized damage-inducible protein DinB
MIMLLPAPTTGGPEILPAIRDNARVTMPFPSPTIPAAGRAEVFVRYLDYFRETVVAKVSALPEAELRTSRLPSGWTPLELVKHLRFVEMRWIEWGFEGRPVAEPWGDERDDRWFVAPSETRAELLAALREQGLRTSAVATSSDLAAVGQPGPRWDGAEPATLERVLFHLLQEYARHVGHLDIVAELAGLPDGE